MVKFVVAGLHVSGEAVLCALAQMVSVAFSQGTTIGSAEGFCSDTGYDFANTTNAGSAEAGPNYNCLLQAVNVSFKYFLLLNCCAERLKPPKRSNRSVRVVIFFI